MRSHTLALLAAVSFVLVTAPACRKPIEHDQELGQPVEITSVGIDRDRDHYRHVVDDEIRWVDRRVTQILSDADEADAGLRDMKLDDVDAAHTWQTRLRHERAAIDTTPDVDWPALKAQIEQDLGQSRPPQLPRTYEKSFGP